MAQKKLNKNQNQKRQKKSSINNNNSKFNRIPSTSKGNGTSININNYYTNNIFNAIYNNFIPNQNLDKKNEVDNNKYKKGSQRASSVFYQKRPISKYNIEKKINKMENHNKINNKYIYKK